jgi:hypothetical protein
MKRTQRNLSIIMTVMVVIYLLLTRLPPPIALGLLAALCVVAASLSLCALDYFIARYHAKRQRWRKASDRYESFEKKLVKRSWRRATVLLYFGIYTFDALAIVRTRIADNLINLDDIDGAERWLKAALERDLDNPAPYVSLGVIAALRGDRNIAHRQMSRAVHLGFSPVAAQEILFRALARADARRKAALNQSD